jgi:hypothetical protein
MRRRARIKRRQPRSIPLSARRESELALTKDDFDFSSLTARAATNGPAKLASSTKRRQLLAWQTLDEATLFLNANIGGALSVCMLALFSPFVHVAAHSGVPPPLASKAMTAEEAFARIRRPEREWDNNFYRDRPRSKSRAIFTAPKSGTQCGPFSAPCFSQGRMINSPSL